jgi:hypothetical protein
LVKFWHVLWFVEVLPKMVLRCWQRSEHAIRESCSRRFPALLDRVEFRSICWESLEAKRLVVSTTELTDQIPFVCRAVVDEKQHATPTSQGELKEFDKLALTFALAERVREPSLGPRPEDVRANIFVVDND